MVQKNFATKALTYILKDIIWDAVSWPFWWYSGGLVDAWYSMIDTIKQANQELALTVWLKNMFVPMYGDYSWQGRLVSFFMRFVIMIGRLLLFIFWFLIAVVVFLLWIILPMFIIYQLIFNVIFL